MLRIPTEIELAELFDRINDEISELSVPEFNLLADAYNCYITTGDRTWFNTICKNFNLKPERVIFWFRY